MSYNKRSTRRIIDEKVSNPSGLTSEAILQFYEALDCPRSLHAALLFKYGEFDQLVSLECNPSHYEDSESFRNAYLASHYLLKNRFLKTSFDKKALAIQKFETFEDRCKQTNLRFRSESSQRNEHVGNGLLLSIARRKISSILGEFSPHELFDLSSWGPGVSTTLKGDHTFAAKKFQYETGITRDLYPLVKDLFPLTYPGWNLQGFQLEVGNSVVTVPKTSKIDRTIAIEPGFNLWLQLGIGRMIRRRLGRVGIDLTDQTRNQKLAKIASLNGSLVTVDFSSASDSIASSVVEDLFSFDQSFRWFEVMDLVRSKYGKVGDGIVRWSKFSSMGNGFTFDLESLIFYAAAVACCEVCGVSVSEVSVYGDDVIIPQAAYETFCSFSSFLGFTVNLEKSFSSGYFRESCGSHYYLGSDCKPVYLQDRLSSFQRVFNFANTVRIRSHYPYGCDVRFRRLFYHLKSSVPKKFRFGVPAMVTKIIDQIEPFEGGFISNFDEVCPQRAKFGIEGFLFKRLRWAPVGVEVRYPGLLQAKLASQADPLKLDEPIVFDKRWRPLNFLSPNLSVRSEGNVCPLRNRVEALVPKKLTFVRQWYDLGPWI